MPCFYLLASKDTPGRQGHDGQWPKVIGWSPQLRCFRIAEGSGHGLMGADLLEAVARQPPWRELFQELGLEWFFAFLHQHGGLSADELLSALHARTGKLQEMS